MACTRVGYEQPGPDQLESTQIRGSIGLRRYLGDVACRGLDDRARSNYSLKEQQRGTSINKSESMKKKEEEEFSVNWNEY